MKLVIGLGNPGSQYEQTRHNVGFMAVETLAGDVGIKISKSGFGSLWCKAEVDGRPVVFCLPQTYMNRSGDSVRQVMDFYRIPPGQVIVAHDDLDLAFGRIKQGFDSGAAGHKGILSMIEQLGTQAFHRIRMGIGRPDRKEEVERFVLTPFRKDEWETVNVMIRESSDLMRKWIKETI